MRLLKIGLCQTNTQNNVENNFKQIEEMTEYCVKESAEIVVFPELSTYLSEMKNIEMGESLDGNIITRFCEIAKRNKIYIHNGSFLEKTQGNKKVYNTSVLINPQGKVLTTYRKIHLFDVEIPGAVSIKESDTIEPGTDVVTLKTDLAAFGFTICYDLRFPYLYRKLTDLGAKIIFVPSAFTLYTGKDHWEVLLRARAIENQVYIVAVNQFGTYDNDHRSFGNSMVIDPWGTVIARSKEAPGCTVVNIDLDYVEKVREKIPCLKNSVAL